MCRELFANTIALSTLKGCIHELLAKNRQTCCDIRNMFMFSTYEPTVLQMLTLLIQNILIKHVNYYNTSVMTMHFHHIQLSLHYYSKLASFIICS